MESVRHGLLLLRARIVRHGSVHIWMQGYLLINESKTPHGPIMLAVKSALVRSTTDSAFSASSPSVLQTFAKTRQGKKGSLTRVFRVY